MKILRMFRMFFASILQLFSWGSRTSEYTIQEIPLDKIVANPFQPRSKIRNEQLQQLAQSIEEYGVIIPIMVTPTDNGLYQLIAGERRVRASRMLDEEQIPALVREYTNEELVEISFLENLQREPIDAVDRAKTYRRLRKEKKTLTPDELSEKLGVPSEEIEGKDWILELPPITQEALSREIITTEHAKLMKEIDDKKIHRKLIGKAYREDLAEYQIEHSIREYVPGKKADPILKEYDQEHDDATDVVQFFRKQVVKLAREKKSGKTSTELAQSD